MVPLLYVQHRESTSRRVGPIRTTNRESKYAEAQRLRASARYCEVLGCGKVTRERKPWCTKHVNSHSPYVLEVHARLSQFDLERSRTRPVPDGLIAGDVLVSVRDLGAASATRIAMDCRITVELAEAYIRALVRSGRIVQAKSRRGVTIASPSRSA